MLNFEQQQGYQGTPNPMPQLQRDFQSQFMRDVRYYNGTSL